LKRRQRRQRRRSTAALSPLYDDSNSPSTPGRKFAIAGPSAVGGAWLGGGLGGAWLGGGLVGG